MKKSRLFVTLLVMFFTASSYAQDSYRETLKDYLAISQKSTYEKMQTAFKQLNATGVFEQKEGVDLDELTTRYINERLGDIMSDAIESAMRETVTENDLRTVIALMNTPEGKTLLEHLDAWSYQLKEDMSNEIRQKYDPSKLGKAMAPVVPKVEIPDSYDKKFMQYMENSHGVEIATNAFTQTMSAMNKMFVKIIGSEMPVGELTDWLQGNITTLAMNSAFGILTTEDLDYSASLFTNDSYRRGVDSSLKLTDNFMEKGMTYVLDYVDWMSEQGISLSAIGQQMINLFKE